MRNPVVYLIKDDNRGLIKIGMSSLLHIREKALKKEFGSDAVTCVAVCDSN